MDGHLHPFPGDVSQLSPPQRFTFPFYYEPHPLAHLAAQALQAHIAQQPWAVHLQHEMGKMFGVLVVALPSGEWRYLAAFSGKLNDSNHLPGFVPPVFDMLTAGSFYHQGMAQWQTLNAQVKSLAEHPEARAAWAAQTAIRRKAEAALAQARTQLKAAKQARKARRATATLTQQAALNQESQLDKIRFKHLQLDWQTRVAAADATAEHWQQRLEAAKQARKQHSHDLQQRLFEAYRFLNARGQVKALSDIFEEGATPAGAGECAAPKLLEYAYRHQLKPLCMAEFWWGASPPSAIRKHGQYYPACRGKCEPILGHMLDGLTVDPNPLIVPTGTDRDYTTIYEDDHILVIDKPAELLSVPGKHVADSVATRLRARYPEATGPLVVHRLDMSTSGLMVIAKTEAHHKYLQYQFIKRRVEKRYEALLEGQPQEAEGWVELPLRVDLDDRPRQMVCHEHGKPARTRYKVVGTASDGRTRVHFFPVTGRTHQLRVHAAHPLGLGCPIVGDDLYGTKGERLHLHAAALRIVHPVTRKTMKFHAPVPF